MFSIHKDRRVFVPSNLPFESFPQAVAADQAVHAIGMPEAGVVIAQCVTCLDNSQNMGVA